MNGESINRRQFFEAGAAAAIAAGVAGPAIGSTNEQGIPTRPFGKSGEEITLLGLGGFHATKHVEESESLALIRKAVDEGIRFLDNAWDYHDGVAEERMGKALHQGKLRDQVFLMTKCCGRTAKEAEAGLADSLRRLKTDHLDLWQFHEICYDNDPDWIFESGGAMEFALKAKEQGKVRHIGFTGHKDPSIHLKMLGKPYDFASVQMPLNVMDAHFRSFQHQVLPVLKERGIAPIAMKSLGGAGKIVSDAGVPVADALRYVLSLPIAVLVSGIDSEAVLKQNLEIVRGFKPLDAAEMRRIEEATTKLAGDGRYELFKSSKTYDGPVHRKQHGFSVDAA